MGPGDHVGTENIISFGAKKNLKKTRFWPFLNPILAIFCPFGGSRGAKNEFFGPEQKNLLAKKFREPLDRRGQPKGGQNRPVGVSNPSKTVKYPHGTCEKWGRP